MCIVFLNSIFDSFYNVRFWEFIVIFEHVFILGVVYLLEGALRPTVIEYVSNDPYKKIETHMVGSKCENWQSC